MNGYHASCQSRPSPVTNYPMSPASEHHSTGAMRLSRSYRLLRLSPRGTSVHFHTEARGYSHSPIRSVLVALHSARRCHGGSRIHNMLALRTDHAGKIGKSNLPHAVCISYEHHTETALCGDRQCARQLCPIARTRSCVWARSTHVVPDDGPQPPGRPDARTLARDGFGREYNPRPRKAAPLRFPVSATSEPWHLPRIDTLVRPR
jgi:hypothetical protein